jgi:hypothetical protein
MKEDITEGFVRQVASPAEAPLISRQCDVWAKLAGSELSGYNEVFTRVFAEAAALAFRPRCDTIPARESTINRP